MMMETILQYDVTALLAINGLHASWADTLFWFVSNRLTWIPLYLVMLGWLFANAKKNKYFSLVVILVLLVATTGATDWLCHWLKGAIARPRPTHTVLLAQLHTINGYLGGKFGMPSSHAADTMALAMLFGLFTRSKGWAVVLTVYVLLNCYSRLYLGVHYPTDILAGLAIGGILAFVVYRLTPKSVRL